MIFAQKPNATACADYDLWNKQMGRYVRRGSKGIALIDTSGDNPRLKYVFDISDTGGRDNSRLKLWEYGEQHQDAVTAALEQRFNVSTSKGLADQIEQIASKLVTEYWNDNSRDILGILADSFLEEYDDYNVEVAFRNATSYKVHKRVTKDKSEWTVIEDSHEAIISKIDFDSVQKVLKCDTRRSPDGKTVGLFSGMVFCGDCGASMVRKTVPAGEKKYVSDNNKWGIKKRFENGTYKLGYSCKKAPPFSSIIVFILS